MPPRPTTNDESTRSTDATHGTLTLSLSEQSSSAADNENDRESQQDSHVCKRNKHPSTAARQRGPDSKKNWVVEGGWILFLGHV